MAKTGKRLAQAYEGIDRNTQYELAAAVKLVKEGAKAKFDETIEMAMNLGVDPRHADQMVRGVVSLPHGTGKTMRVAVFAKEAKAEEAQKAGADAVGAEDLMEAMQKGDLNYDRVIATPDMMAVVGRLGKFGFGIMKKKAKALGDEFAEAFRREVAEWLGVNLSREFAQLRGRGGPGGGGRGHRSDGGLHRRRPGLRAGPGSRPGHPGRGRVRHGGREPTPHRHPDAGPDRAHP